MATAKPDRAAKLRAKIEAARALAERGETEEERDTAARTVARLQELLAEVDPLDGYSLDLSISHEHLTDLAAHLGEIYEVEVFVYKRNRRKLRLQGSPRACAIIADEMDRVGPKYMRALAVFSAGWLAGRYPKPPRTEAPTSDGPGLDWETYQTLRAGLRSGRDASTKGQQPLQLRPPTAGLLGDG